MRPIGSHGLACIEDTDYADYALYMQCMAETIDAGLMSQLAEFDSLIERPTMVVGATANVTTASGVATTNFFNDVVFNNSDFMDLATTGTETYITIGSPITTPDLVPYLRGMYLVGASCAADATGAVTAFSQRNLTVSATDDTLVGPTQIAFAYDINADANTAITNIRMNTGFSIVLRGTNGVRIRPQISHTNAASTVTFAAADARLWVTYLGPTNLVEVP